MKIRNTAIVLALIVGLFALNPSGAQSNDVPTWQFSVKFVCGQAQGEGDGMNSVSNNTNGRGLDDDRDPVVPGVYETAINLHNPNQRTVEGEDDVPPNTPSDDSEFSEGFRKKALVLYPPFREEVPEEEATAAPTGGGVVEDDFERAQPPGFWVRPDSLGSDWGLEIDCRDIRAVLLGGRCEVNEVARGTSVSDPCESDDVGPDPRAHAPLIKGYIVIEERSRLPLDVTALYSGYNHTESLWGYEGDLEFNGVQPTGFSEQVETIDPKKIDDDDNDDNDD